MVKIEKDYMIGFVYICVNIIYILFHVILYFNFEAWAYNVRIY